MLEFEWDIQKNKQNMEKHGIDFADAALIFDYPILQYQDNRQDYGEQRFLGIGVVKNVEIIVVYTQRDKKIRLISARSARKDERQRYRSLYPKKFA